jgi:NTP pyrophosphatase (non-canonical NTP hydrolase)
MTLNEYQQQAMSTCTQSCDNFGYMFLNLVGEVGELASKVAKGIRKEEVLLFDNDLRYPRGIDGEIAKVKQIQELGDCLWMIAGLARTYGYSLEEVAQKNLDKLAKRKQAGTIIGDGDGIYNR